MTNAAVWGEDFRAGSARVDITPPVGFPLWGYAARRDLPSTGIRDPLFARSVVLAAGSEKFAIVSLDLGRPPTRESMKIIRARLHREANIDHLFIVATHTHHGPVIETTNWPTPKDSYVSRLEGQIVDVVQKADRDVRDARFGIMSTVATLNRNRQSKLVDKSIDPELTLIRIEDRAGKPISHLINFAAHPTLLDSKSREISGDYPGALARLVEKSGDTCLFLQGAAGDLSANTAAGATPDSFAQELFAKIDALDKKLVCKLEKPSRLQVREHEFTFGKRLDLGNPFVRATFSLVFFKDLVDFYEREYREGVRPHLTTALLDSRFGFVGVSGEFFSGHSVQLKRRARLDNLVFMGYCNDYQQYFPTIEAAAEGGYGTDPAVSPVEVGAGERVMDQALIDLFEMRKSP